MELIGTIISIAAIAILIAVAFTLGLAVLSIILLFSVAATILYVGSQYWRRWQFLRHGKTQERPQDSRITIIETDYEDLTDKK